MNQQFRLNNPWTQFKSMSVWGLGLWWVFHCWRLSLGLQASVTDSRPTQLEQLHSSACQVQTDVRVDDLVIPLLHVSIVFAGHYLTRSDWAWRVSKNKVSESHPTDNQTPSILVASYFWPYIECTFKIYINFTMALQTWKLFLFRPLILYECSDFNIRYNILVILTSDNQWWICTK